MCSPDARTTYTRPDATGFSRKKLAEPITSAEALVEALGLGRTPERREEPGETVRRHFSSALSPQETEAVVKLYGLIRRNRGVSYDELCGMSGLGYSKSRNSPACSKTPVSSSRTCSEMYNEP